MKNKEEFNLSGLKQTVDDWLKKDNNLRGSSLEAHEKIKPLKNTHYNVIKEVLIINNKSMTSKQISEKCSLGYHQVARRLSEMEKIGMIKVVGRCPYVLNRPLLWQLIAVENTEVELN